MFGACCLLQCTANLPNKIFDCFSHLFELLIDSPNLANSNDNRNGLGSRAIAGKEKMFETSSNAVTLQEYEVERS